MRLFQSFVIAMSMYSKIPMPRMEWDEKNMKYAMCFFPVVGAVIGVCVWGVGTLLLRLSVAKLLFAGAMTLLPILISGGIHLDGFMDTMDALHSYGDREKKLQILKDPHAGAFAILGLGCYLVWSLAVWSEVTEEMLPVIAVGYVLSRALSGLSVVSFPPARENGLVRTFRDSAQKKVVGVTMLFLMAASGAGMLVLHPLTGAAAIGCALLSFAYYYSICRKQFGGMTGDLAGYFLQICELAMLSGIMVAGGGLWK